MKHLLVLGSQNGSNFQAIAEYFKNFDVQITCVSDNKDALILQRAQESGIENHYVPFEQTGEFISKRKFDLCAMAGYMRILPKTVLDMTTFINLHPSLLPAFKGKNAIEEAYNYGVKVTGVSVHYASEEVDGGEIIAQIPVFIENGMSLHELEQEIHAIEHKLYPLAIQNLLFDRLVEPHMALNSGGCSGGCGGGCSKH